MSASTVRSRFNGVHGRLRPAGRHILDGAVALVLGVATVASSSATSSVDPFVVYRPHDAIFVALVSLCIGLLMFRRTKPLVVLIVEFAVITGLWTAGYNTGALPGVLLVVVYSTVAYASRREAFGAAAVAAACTAFLYFSNAPAFRGGEAIACIVSYAAAIGVGSAYRTQRQLTEALARERVEATRAQVLDERLHIAREVHDIVAHSLGVIAVQAGVGAHLMDGDPQAARAALMRIAERSRSSLDELRTVLAGLRCEDQTPGSLDHAQLRPVPSIDDLPELLRERTTIDFKPTLTTVGPFEELPTGVGHAVFRIVQEALTNAVRHGRATAAAVTIERDQGGIRLSVLDSGGCADEPANNETRAGYGMIGMRERAEIVGGSLRAGPASSGGFEVVAFLPVAGDARPVSEPSGSAGRPA